VWLDGLSLREAPDGPELLEEADVNRPTMGVYNLRDSFILDKVIEAAERHGIYLQVCLLSNPTRDLYMARLKDPTSPEYEEAIVYARRIFRYAVARWGYSTAVAVWEFFNEMNPGLPTDRFYAEVGRYIKAIDPYQRPITTSAWHSHPRDWRHPQLDIANEHFYLRPSEKEETWKDEVASVLARVRFVREHMPSDRPAMLAEFGLATKDWRQSPYMNRDAKLSHFHNSLWASALSGLAGTALFWWWETLDRMNAYEHYRPLAAFLKGIPLNRGDWRDLRASVSDPRVRAVGLQARERVDLWLFNSEASWYRTLVEGAKPNRVRGARVVVEGLVPGTYRVQWWHTYEGRVVGEEQVATADGRLRLRAPDFSTDIACRAVRVTPTSPSSEGDGRRAERPRIVGRRRATP
jgi:hypothetical protein